MNETTFDYEDDEIERVVEMPEAFVAALQAMPQGKAKGQITLTFKAETVSIGFSLLMGMEAPSAASFAELVSRN